MKPHRLEVFDSDDTFCAAHGGQQLAFWNAHQANAASRRCTHLSRGERHADSGDPASGTHPEGHRGEDRHQARDQAHEETLAENPDYLARRHPLAAPKRSTTATTSSALPAMPRSTPGWPRSPTVYASITG
jgi:hypothetical protein